MTIASAIIPFHGATLRVVKAEDAIWVAIKPICEHLGIDWATQLQKLRLDPEFNCRAIPMVAEDGKEREMAALPETEVLGWLYTINSRRVASHARGLLKQYREETTQVINAYWTQGQATNPRFNTLPDMTDPIVLAQQFIQAETERRALAAQAQANAPKVEAFEALMDSSGLYSIRNAAKLLNTGERKLFEVLRDGGVLMRAERSGAENHNVPYQRFIDAGYFQVKTSGSRDGEHVSRTTRVTTKGLEYIRRRFFVGRPLPLLDVAGD